MESIEDQIIKAPSRFHQFQIVCRHVFNTLHEKNTEYGDSALSPIRIFVDENTPPSDSLKERIDDKLSRIKNGTKRKLKIKEDTLLDLIGYLVLLYISLILERK